MNPTRRVLLPALILLALVLLPSYSFSANHYIVRGGTGTQTGADWNNAFTDFPVNLVRGDTYFIAGSNTTYPPHDFKDAVNGTLVITIKKATDADHGTDTGYLSQYGSLGAVWTAPSGSSPWAVRTGFYTFDGAYGQGETPGGYGFLLLGSATTIYQGGFIHMGCGSCTLTNLTFQHIEISNTVCCGAISDSTTGSDAFEGTSGDTNNNLTVQFCFIHDISGSPFHFGASPAFMNNVLLTHNVIARNRSTSAQHAEGISANQVNNLTSAYNIWEDVQGTGVFVALNFLNQNWTITGDLIFTTTNTIGYGLGAIDDNSGSGTLQNLTVTNVTIANYQAGSNVGISLKNANSTGAVVENNLWWNIGSCCVVTLPEGVNGTHDYNTLLNARLNIANTPSAHDVVIPTGATDPFINDAGKNYHLAAATTAGLALTGSLATRDADGNLRGADGLWDRGTFEFLGTPPPPTPTGLAAVVH